LSSLLGDRSKNQNPSTECVIGTASGKIHPRDRHCLEILDIPYPAARTMALSHAMEPVMDIGVLTSLLAVTIARAAERLMLVLAGMLAIWLGYRLFAQMPTADKSEGNLKLPGGVSIHLSRTGPGLFFALFGAAIIGYSVTRPFDLKIPAEIAATRPGAAEVVSGRSIQLTGFGPVARPAAPPASATAGPDTETLLARLNFYFEEQSQHLERLPREEWDQALRRAKLALMLQHWQLNWGGSRRLRHLGGSRGRSSPADGARRRSRPRVPDQIAMRRRHAMHPVRVCPGASGPHRHRAN
jgi:hypothetical protein